MSFSVQSWATVFTMMIRTLVSSAADSVSVNVLSFLFPVRSQSQAAVSVARTGAEVAIDDLALGPKAARSANYFPLPLPDPLRWARSLPATLFTSLGVFGL